MDDILTKIKIVQKSLDKLYDSYNGTDQEFKTQIDEFIINEEKQIEKYKIKYPEYFI